MDVVILARHGESEFSLRNALNGDARAVGPLTPAGIEQARRLGELLAGEPIDLCVTSEFERTRQTAEVALAGREIPRLVLPELNDPRYGAFEGGLLADYLAWAWAHGSRDEPPGGGECRLAIFRRYARGLATLLERPERTILVVAHSLPIAYVLAAAEGRDPAPRMGLVEYVRPYRHSAGELRRAVERLEAWCAAPTW